MKRKILLLALLSLNIFACKKNDNPQNSKKLKSYTAYLSHTIEPALSQVKTFIADQEIYDEDGKLISSTKGNIVYDTPGSYSTTLYSYKDGIVSETSDGFSRNVYVYQNNLLSEMDYYAGDYQSVKKGTILQVEVYTYDAQNRKIKTTLYGDLAKTVQKNVYTFEYNADNLVAKQIDSGGTTTYYEYDGHKNLAKVYYSNVIAPNTTSGKESYNYKYDETGKITEITQSDYNGNLHKIQIIYDDSGKVITKNVLTYGAGGYGPMSTLQYSYTYF